MFTKLNTSALALSASLALFSGQASAEFLDFTIDEGSVPGAFPNVIIGDKLNGGYEEIISISVGGPTGLQFDTQAFATMGQIFAGEGTPPAEPSQLGSFGANGYNMYAVFSAAGNVSGTTFTATSGAFDLYIDPDQDTSADLSGGGAVPPALSGTADDYLIAFASNPTSLVGIVGNPGAFDFVWDDFTLTADGSNYFTAPVPFHMNVTVDGDFDEFPIAPGDISLTGDVSAVFEVPVPSTLMLFGLTLMGLGARMRKA